MTHGAIGHNGSPPAMGFYNERVVPYLVHFGMKQEMLTPFRRRVVGEARGRVLEVGVGSGLNLPLYTSDVQRVIAFDPSSRLLAMAADARSAGRVPIELIEASAEMIPVEDHSIDTVVTTWTLCTIPDVAAALLEMRRVLAPSGELLFVEHGRAPEPAVQRWQDRLNPLWKRVAGGCHLNRPIRTLLEDAGFRVTRIETGYIEGPRPLTFLYEGRARPG